jgi:hypothetical protein
MGGESHYLPSTPTAETAADGTSNSTAIEKQRADNKAIWNQENAQAQQNQAATTQANRPNITTAYGGQKWTTGPDGKPQLTTSFDGALGDANNSLQQQYADALRNPLGTGDDARNQAITAAYGQATSRLDPQWDKRQEAMRTQLLNQGLDPSSQAYQSQMQDFGQQRNDAYGSAMNSAIGQGAAAGHMALSDNMAARNSYLQGMQGMNSLTDTPKFNGAGNITEFQKPVADWLEATRDTNNAFFQNHKADQDAALGIMKMGTSMLGGLGGK